MTDVKALRKENQDLKNQVEQLSKEFKNLNAKIVSQPNQPDATSWTRTLDSIS